MAKLSQEFLRHIGMPDYQQIEPKASLQLRLQHSMNMIQELPESLGCLKSLFDEELKEIVWLEATAKDAPAFASAAYPEVPGKVFITAAVFAYLPPALCPEVLCAYCAFENMVHECLHHRGEKVFSSHPRISKSMMTDGPVSVSWRKTSWSFSHAIQAYYVYLWIRSLRYWRSQQPNETVKIRDLLSQSLIGVDSIIDELEIQLSLLADMPRSELRRLCTSA